jgi:cellulose 1,4-beta-cellobiosidase
MIRESTNANAANAFIAETPGNGVTWQTRSTTGGSSGNAATAGLSAPYWVKLVRSGNTFTGYCSPDGTNWTQQGTAAFTTASTAYVGLAVTAHNDSSLCAATFDSVNAPGWPLLPGAPASLTATAGNALVALSWAAVSGASSYNLKSATNNGGPYTVLSNVTTTNYTNTGLINGSTCYYVVSALNIAGESTNSVQVSATPQAPPLLNISVSSRNLVFSWRADSAAFTLQSRSNLTLGGWVNVILPAPQITNGQWQATLPTVSSGSVFYRLSN